MIVDKQKEAKLVHAEQTEGAVVLPQNHKLVRKDLPTYSMDDVGKHATR